ncbi:MAG TPA: BON domain-containing protein [Blastocatellia bacterium]|nr:BON domain-containing protein [Blastocatellia bacterium]
MRQIIALILFSLLMTSLACQKPANNKNANGPSTAAPSANAGEPNDAWITVKTKLALIADKQTSGFETSVDTKDGIVTLSGKVDTDQAKSAASAAAMGVKGVKSVDNQLQVVPEATRKQVDQADKQIDGAISQKMKDDPTLKSLNLSATSNNGVVVLTGSVNNQRQLLTAASEIRAVQGVRSVDTHQVTVKNERS